MTESWLAQLRARHADIERRLEEAGAQVEREASKREIIAYFKEVDGALSELTGLKESIRALVERYKELSGTAEGAQAPQFTGARPAVHADHLGASTYIEKGWSLISLGDHTGAIQALDRALSLAPDDTQARPGPFRRSTGPCLWRLTIPRRGRCLGGPRCSMRITTTPWPRSPRSS